MEKTLGEPVGATQRHHNLGPPRPGRLNLCLQLLTLFIGVNLLGVLPYLGLFDFWPRHLDNGASVSSYNPMNPWESITPSEELEWHPCYGLIKANFRCARLTVPMDYNRPLSQSRAHPKVHIALLLLPGATPNTSETASKSPLLLNPGGPGGSGVMILLAMADAIQKILAPDQPIIGFDPRGVSFTTPRADCWAKPPACTGCPEDAASGLMHRLEWDQMNSVYGLLNSSNVALKFLEAGHRAVNDLCRSKDAQLGAESILGHASTAHVARDMVSIVDAWDRWIESRGLPPSSLKGKLVYWGFSYGTYLGATFAKMFPDRVGRMILDGVVDADYYVSPVWEESLLDTDKVLDRFFLYCARAGRRCSLYREGDKAEDVGRRYSEIMERLQTSPVTFTHPEHFYPVILRASYVKTIVFSVLYSPIQGFPILAMLLNWVHEGKFDELAGLFQDATLMCSIIGNPAITGMLSDAQRAIMCSDKTQLVNLTIPEITTAYEQMASTSQFADIWMNLMLKCNGWDISTPHPISSASSTPSAYPWSPQASTPAANNNNQSQIETSFPLLFLSNTYDPVTPLHAAVKMAQRFKNAGLVEQLAQGHCTLSAVSGCTARIVREYVLQGKVPPPPVVFSPGENLKLDGEGEWTRCRANEGPWGVHDQDADWVQLAKTGGVAVEQVEDEGVVEAWRRVHEAVASVRKWGVMEREWEGFRFGNVW